MPASGVPIAPVMAFCFSSPIMDPEMIILNAERINNGCYNHNHHRHCMGFLAGSRVLGLQRLDYLRRLLRKTVDGGCMQPSFETQKPVAISFRFWHEPMIKEEFRSQSSRPIFVKSCSKIDPHAEKGKPVLLQNVITIALEMKSPDDFRPKTTDREDVRVEKIGIPSPSLNHYFFVNVGRPWKWYSRLRWTLSDWQTWVENENVHTFVGYVEKTPFGYIELHQQDDAVEIAFFGVLPQFIGLGLGGYLLSEAIRLAWQLKPVRVWVHTCTHDHQYALNNYQARGLTIFQRTSEIETIPDEDDPVWATPAYYRSLAEEYSVLGRQHAKEL